MTPKTSGDSIRGVSGYILKGIQDSFTIHEPPPPRLNPARVTASYPSH
jgi:hypothetical protein